MHDHILNSFVSNDGFNSCQMFWEIGQFFESNLQKNKCLLFHFELVAFDICLILHSYYEQPYAIAMLLISHQQKCLNDDLR